jgi:hypothetical protein
MSNMKIVVGFLTGNLLSTRTPTPDEVNAYAYSLHKAIKGQYPGAEVQVRQETGSGSIPAGLRTQVYTENLDDASIAQDVDLIQTAVWEDWCENLKPQPGEERPCPGPGDGRDCQRSGSGCSVVYGDDECCDACRRALRREAEAHEQDLRDEVARGLADEPMI